VSARGILAGWLALVLLELAWETALTLLNMAHAARLAGAVPPAFVGAVDAGSYARSVSYTLARGRLALAEGCVASAALLAAVLGGLFGALDRTVRAIPVPPWLQGVIFLACLFGLSRAVGLPFALYSTFRIEARFGFNRTTVRLFIADRLKGLALSAVIGIPTAAGLLLLMGGAGRLWWLWAFLAAAGLQLALSVLHPLVIAPLFNSFTPLAPGPLRESILGLAARLGVRVNGVFVMDGSRRSGHSNAYFTGIGRAKRIVLFDTLVGAGPGAPPAAEVLAVLSHEMGHERLRHVAKGLAVSLAASLAGFGIAGLLLRWPGLFQAFGFDAASPHALLALLGFGAGPFTLFLTPLASLWSRRHEYDADLFAVQAMGSADGMKAALLRLARDNLSNLAPHRLYSFFHYSHPALSERIAALEAAEARLRAGGSTS
jgi:STE24 endopeptidase